MWRGLSLKTKIIVSFLLLVGSAIFLIGFIGFITAKDAQQQQALTNLILISNIKRGTVEAFMIRVGGRTKDFSSDGFIRDETKNIISLNKSKDIEIIKQRLKEHLLNNKMPLDEAIGGIVVTDLNGDVVASTDSAEIGENEANHYYFLKARDGSYGEYVFGEVEGSHHFGLEEPLLAVASPLYDTTKDERLGVIINYVKISQLDKELRAEIERQGGFSYKTLETVLINENKLLISNSRFVESAILHQEADTIPVNECLKAKKNYYGRYYDYRGVLVFGASECIQNGWTLVTKVDEDELFEKLRALRDGIALISMAIILLEIWLLYLLALSIVRPIHGLSEVAKKIAAGDTKLRATVLSKDDIGRLAVAFNLMAEKLIEANRGLERKVEERTADLQKFQSAVEGASDHVIITDKEGTVLYANKAAERITGYSEKEMLGKKAGVLWGKQMPLAFYKKMWKRIKIDKKIFKEELKNKRKNGQIYTAEINIAPILDSNGNVKFFVGIERDITEIKEIDRAKTEFVSIASHQLRTPLTGIKWYLELLLSDDKVGLALSHKKYAEEAYRSNERVIKLVDALLNVSRIDSGTFAIIPEPVKIGKIVDAVVNELGSQIRLKRISVHVKVAKALPIFRADFNLMKIIIQNLISNSVKYTPSGGKINISALRDKKDLILSVADDGYGIPASDQSRIFTKFFRADNIREKDVEGTGLGLYVVKSIVERAGGKVWFESTEGKGTVFYVKIPLKGMKKKPGTKGLLPI